MSDYTIYAEEKDGYKLEIISGDTPLNPRIDYDNAGHMICFHSRYDLGDKHKYETPRDAVFDLFTKYATDKEKRKYIIANCNGDTNELRFLIKHNGKDLDGMIDDIQNSYSIKNCNTPNVPEAVIALPIYLYDHSGITISTGKFNDPWDSGQIGFIYMTEEERVKEQFATREDAVKCLEGEVKVYDQYLTGDVYGYVISKKNKCDCCGHTEKEVIESCWGFFGSEYAIEEGKSMLEYAVKEHLEVR